MGVVAVRQIRFQPGWDLPYNMHLRPHPAEHMHRIKHIAMHATSTPPSTAPRPRTRTFCARRSSVQPPPMTTPSSTAALVALSASSTRSFFSFSSVSVWAPTCGGSKNKCSECMMLGTVQCPKHQIRAPWDVSGAHMTSASTQTPSPRPGILRGKPQTRHAQGANIRLHQVALREIKEITSCRQPHLDDGHTARQACNALAQLLTLILLWGVTTGVKTGVTTAWLPFVAHLE